MAMDEIDYAEKVAAATLQQVMQTYDIYWERAHKFAALAFGGAVTIGVYALGKIGTGQNAQLAPLLSISAWLFLIVFFLLIKGTKSNPHMAGSNSAHIRERLAKNTKYVAELADVRADNGRLPTGDEKNETSWNESQREAALWNTRWDNLSSIDIQIERFSKSASKRAKALDFAYWLLASTPLVALAAYFIALR
jgi:hypothetical protein